MGTEMTDMNFQEFAAEARRLLPLVAGATWAASEMKPAYQHACDISDMFYDGQPDSHPLVQSEMHLLINQDGKTLAIIGNTISSNERARFLAGLIHSLPTLLEFVENHTDEQKDARIIELIKSNNEKLFENRKQREEIRALKAREARLLTLISDEMLNKEID
jgi:signal transduction histidine kinase